MLVFGGSTGSAMHQSVGGPLPCFNQSASSRMTRIRSDFPSKPMPGRSGILM